MNLLHRARSFAAWLVALAMLLGALAPAAAQVMADARGQHWVQICSAGGVVWVRLGADGVAGAEQPGEPASDGQRHCPWCQLGDGAGLPPQPVAFDSPTPLSTRVLFGTSDLVLQALWRSALSRAPPRV